MHTFWPALGFGLVTASILALAAVGFTLQFGVTNVFNLAYGEVMGVAGFVALMLNDLGLSIWLAMVGGAAAAAVLSYAINAAVLQPFLRRGTKPWGLVIITIALALIIENTVLAITGANFFSYHLPISVADHIGPFLLTVPELIIIAVSVVAMICIHLLLKYTKIGMAMRATSNNDSLARVCGVKTSVVVGAAWLISGALCGLAGVAYFINTATFEASTANGFLIVIVAAAVLGGIGEPYGAMLGALVIGVTSEVAAAYINPSYKNVIAFAILVIILITRPRGIISAVAGQRQVAA
jgi:branched-chain amino acid transport system permease protein/neutral amino acid transport system permease protein